MKIKIITAVLAAMLMLSACGAKEAAKPKEQIDNKVIAEKNADGERELIEDAALVLEGETTVGTMLDCFKALDYEGALKQIREADRALFALDNTSQKTLYDTLFAKLSYELGESYIKDNKHFVDARITAPDMLDVYGELNLRYIDAIVNGEIRGEEESRSFNNKVLKEIIDEVQIDLKTMTVPVELMEENGALRVVFTADIMNAMLGDIQTAQQQVSKAIEEGMAEYNSAMKAD